MGQNCPFSPIYKDNRMSKKTGGQVASISPDHRTIRGHSIFFGRDVWHGVPKWESKGLIFFPFFFFAKVRLRNWKYSKFWGLMNWNVAKFRLQDWKFLKFWQISLVGVKIYYFSSEWGSKELNHAATGDLKMDVKGMKRGSWPPDIPILPVQVSAPLQKTIVSKVFCLHTQSILHS